MTARIFTAATLTAILLISGWETEAQTVRSGAPAVKADGNVLVLGGFRPVGRTGGQTSARTRFYRQGFGARPVHPGTS